MAETCTCPKCGSHNYEFKGRKKTKMVAKYQYRARGKE